MSGNRRKNTTAKPAAETAPEGAPRVVSIPKDTAKPEPKAKARADRIGDILRQARLDRNEDLYQIAEYLCIKPAFLIALENSQYDEFPADAYVIGFLRTYASFLGINGKDAVDRYRYEMAGRRKKPILSMPQPMSEGRAPSAIIMVIATIAILLIYALWYGFSSSNRTEVNIAPPIPAVQSSQQSSNQNSTPSGSDTGTVSSAAGLTAPVTSPSPATDQTKSVTLPVAINTPDNALLPPAGIPLAGAAPQSTTQPLPPKDSAAPVSPPSPAAAAAPAPADTKDAKDSKKQVYGDANEAAHIIIRATQSTWVMVTDDSGKAIFDHVLKPGESYKVPNKPGLSLTTGNGNGITLSVNGNDIPKIASGAPHVVRNIPLDPDKLSALSVE